MEIERERRFLIDAAKLDGFKALRQFEIIQGYLANVDGPTPFVTRVRLYRNYSKTAQLTVKVSVNKTTRQEFNYTIPLSDAEALIAIAPTSVHKNRHVIVYDEHIWEVDYFYGENQGLVIAEVECDADATLANIEIPPWCIREITGIPAYNNSALASHPYSEWSDAEKSI